MGSFHSSFQGSKRSLDGKSIFVRVHAMLAALVDDALRIEKHDVFFSGTEMDIHPGTGDPCGPGAVDDDLEIFQRSSDKFTSILLSVRFTSVWVRC